MPDIGHREKIRRYVTSVLKEKGDRAPFRDDEALVSSGRIDSLAVVEMVVFFEEEFGIDFSDRPFDQNDFDSVDRMLAIIET